VSSDDVAADLAAAIATARAGGSKDRLGTKLPVRERLRLLLDDGSFVEDGLLANALSDGYPADGVITGVGRIEGRHVAVIAHDPTVKAGSWGERTVEKQVRILERADLDVLPVFYLVDSAGGRLSDQLGFFPGRRGASHLFHLQIALSGKVPQLCCLFGPSAAGGAYMPAFCDWVSMVDGNASMYLASPRVAEMVTGERSTLEEMGGATLHTTVSGCADLLCHDDAEAIAAALRVFSYLPRSWKERPASTAAAAPEHGDWDGVIPENQRRGYDVRGVITRVADAGGFCEIKPEWAKEIVVGFARIGGAAVGIVANQPKVRGGAIFVDSADKAARFITWCDAFNIPLVFLHDVPGFMVGVAVERQGIIRHGAKMIAAMSSAEVPKFSVVLRKAYAAGFYAMGAPGFEPRATIALPSASIAAMGADAAVNAIYAAKIAELPEDEREAYVAARRAEYEADLGLLRLGSDLIVDAVVEPEALRDELIARLAAAEGWQRSEPRRHHGVFAV
jgi:acetyl-CoA carboxylase carboxyltransferase component